MTTWQSQTTQPRGTRPNVATPLSPPLAGTINVCTVGTSETYAQSPIGNWREPFLSLVTDPSRGNLAVTMTGCYSSGTAPANATHAIVASNTTQMLAAGLYDIATIPRLFATFAPHVCIVEHGTNNAVVSLAATFRADYVALIAYLNSLSPTTRFVLLTCPTVGDATRRGYIDGSINTVWAGIQSDLDGLGISYVQAEARVLTFGPDQLISEAPSYLHWNTSGALKIADAVYPAFMNACGYDATW